MQDNPSLTITLFAAFQHCAPHQHHHPIHPSIHGLGGVNSFPVWAVTKKQHGWFISKSMVSKAFFIIPSLSSYEETFSRTAFCANCA
jgi:hypothetical protein